MWSHWPAKLVTSASERESARDRKSTRLNSSHVESSYAVFCLKNKIVHAELIDPATREALVMTDVATDEPVPTHLHPLSLHDALPIYVSRSKACRRLSSK